MPESLHSQIGNYVSPVLGKITLRRLLLGYVAMVIIQTCGTFIGRIGAQHYRDTYGQEALDRVLLSLQTDNVYWAAGMKRTLEL